MPHASSARARKFQNEKSHAPALKGRKMNGLGTRYLWSRASIKRSGSNSRAAHVPINGCRKVMDNAHHQVPKNLYFGALATRYNRCCWIYLRLLNAIEN